MAINILTEPTNPPIPGDYTLDRNIQQALEVPRLSRLTLWEDTASIPAFRQGTFISHASNLFEVQGSNETITGSLAAGINYIVATESAGVITLAWTQSTTGYSFNQVQAGIYNGAGSQLLRDVCYLDGTDYIRGWADGMDFSIYRLADGTLSGSSGLKISGSAEFQGDLTVQGDFNLAGNITTATLVESTASAPSVTGNTWTFPQNGLYTGIYLTGTISTNANYNVQLEEYVAGAWRKIDGFAAFNNTDSVYIHGTFMVDTSSMRVRCTAAFAGGSPSGTIYYSR